MAVLAQQLAQQQLFRLLTPAEFRNLLINTGTQIFDEEGDQNGNGVIDGHEEDDNVTNTGLGFRRADMLALAQGIMNLRPPNNRNIDLSGAEFDIVDGSLGAGNSMTVNFQVQNTGLDAAGAFDVNFYLSADPTITQQDYFLGNFHFLSLGGQSSTGLGTTLILPDLNDPIWQIFGNGFGFIGMFVDANNAVGEPNAEGNNINTGFGIDFDNFPARTVTITVDRVHALDNLDRGRIPRNQPADFYTRLFISGQSWTSGDIGDDNDIFPNWQFSYYTIGWTIPLLIQIWEEDESTPDEFVDINPAPGLKDILLGFDLITGAITGELIGQAGQQLFSFGAGDDSRGEIWFTVSFG